MNIIRWLENFFNECCNGDWEHFYGIKIETLDNPGWLVDIDLTDTKLENRTFKEINIERNDFDWIFCRIDKKKYSGRCGINNLEEMLLIFKEWVTSNR